MTHGERVACASIARTARMKEQQERAAASRAVDALDALDALRRASEWNIAARVLESAAAAGREAVQDA